MEPPPKIITETEYVKPSKPIVPNPPQLTMREIEFIIVTPENVDEVLRVALKNELKRIEWTEVENISKNDKDQKSQASIQ